MARILHLHIGLPKTASTWLQEDVFPEFAHLEVRCVPRTRLFSAPADAEAEHRLMGCALRRAASVWTGLGDAIFGELLGEREAWLGSTRDLLVSDEAIGRRASRPELLSAHLQAIARAAERWGFDALGVIALIRRQDHWIASHYAQISDRRPNAGQKDFEAMVGEMLDPARERFGFGMLMEYDALVAALGAAIRPERLRVMPYEALETDRSGSLRALLSALGTPPESAERVLDRLGAARSNRRGQGGRWTLRPAAGGPAAGPLHHLRRAVGGRGPATGTIALTPALSQRILTTFEESNRALALRTGLDLAGHGYCPEAAA